MPRWFNTAGPCNPADHYMLPAMRRLPEVRSLIEQKSYFVVHAPRQVGKTTALLSLAQELTAEGRYTSALVSLEPGRPFASAWRQHGEPLLGTAAYHEIAPHLVLMAFLHRVVNGGGSIEREYAIGRGRMDLCVRYGPDTLAMELKVWRDRDGDKDPVAAGLEQLDGYLAGLGLDSGWLVIFDQRSDRGPVASRTRAEQATTASGRGVTVLRC